MSEEKERGCDPDDVICQMEVLRHLKGLEEHLGKQLFLEKYPESTSLRDKIVTEIKKQEQVVEEAIGECAQEAPKPIDTSAGKPPNEGGPHAESTAD